VGGGDGNSCSLIQTARMALGNFATLAAIRRASSFVSNLAADSPARRILGICG
jgi:hypothetical protein